MEALVYAANFLYIGSYMVRDILYLRLFTIVAACCLAAYFYSQPEPMMTVVGWNLFFIGLNVFQLTRICLARVKESISCNEVESITQQENAGTPNFQILPGAEKI